MTHYSAAGIGNIRAFVVQNGIRTKDINRLKALDATKITMAPSAYFYFDDGSLLNMTRSLGHYPTSLSC